MVNAALYLRRPLLVTGKPGTGKSTLAYAISEQLGLGPVLNWPINTRMTLQDGLYRYDAIGRLRDSNIAAHRIAGMRQRARPDNIHDLGRYIRLGPLGTALLPWSRPRVLLIDEIDKSDIDLPNDLLHVFEDGEFVIPELTRLLPQSGTGSAQDEHETVDILVQTEDEQMRAIPNGIVRCTRFPIVILTSNGERDFPPAFLRRCLRLEMPQPAASDLEAIIRSHLGNELFAKAEQQIRDYVADFVLDRDQRKKGDLATDQLLNLVYMTTQDLLNESLDLTPEVREKLKKELLRTLA